jgi:hypothetical protein
MTRPGLLHSRTQKDFCGCLNRDRANQRSRQADVVPIRNCKGPLRRVVCTHELACSMNRSDRPVSLASGTADSAWNPESSEPPAKMDTPNEILWFGAPQRTRLISGPSGLTLYGVVLGEAGWDGPVSLSGSMNRMEGFCRLGLSSPDGRCRPLDQPSISRCLQSILTLLERTRRNSEDP